jgi:cyclin-dependent kinase-like
MQKYEVIDACGSGAYGMVFKAVNSATGEQVAIKKFKESGELLTYARHQALRLKACRQGCARARAPLHGATMTMCQPLLIVRVRAADDDEIVRKTTLREVKMLRMLRQENIVDLKEAFRRKKRLVGRACGPHRTARGCTCLLRGGPRRVRGRNTRRVKCLC